MVTPSRPTFAALGCLPVAGNTAERACLVRTAPAVTTPHAITPDSKVPRYLASVKFALGPSHRIFIILPAAAHPLQAAATAACGLASQEKRGIDTTRRGHKTQFWRAHVVSSKMDVASPHHRLVPGGFAREIGFVCLRVVAVARESSPGRR